jgi:hypothetical protein
MVALTRDAQGYLDRYMRQVKATLQGHPSVDATDVERDVLGHIEAELVGAQEPVSAANLRAILDRLGSPSQWVPTDDLPYWRQVLMRLRSGPEDWRLTYLTFALFVAGPVLGMPPLAFASIPLARATLAHLAEYDEPVGARRWLLYPPLILFYWAGACVLFFWPLFPVFALSEIPDRAAFMAWLEPFWVVLPSLVTIGLGIWWIVLGLGLARFTHALEYAFWPFADWWERRHSLRLALAGLALVSVAAVALVAARAM